MAAAFVNVSITMNGCDGLGVASRTYPDTATGVDNAMPPPARDAASNGDGGLVVMSKLKPLPAEMVEILVRPEGNQNPGAHTSIEEVTS